MKKLTALLALLLAGVLGLAACGNDTTSSSSGNPSTAQVNKADVEFTQGMIPHHQQAVVMAQMAKTHADSPQVQQLASDIEAAQGPEIDTMKQWLKDWGKDRPSSSSDGGMGGMDMGDGSHMDTEDMPGIMSDADMHELDQAHGTSWDRMFLTLMIRHHRGAIEMAKTEQANGKSPDAVTLAKKIQTAQTSEIATMKQMLRP